MEPAREAADFLNRIRNEDALAALARMPEGCAWI